MLRDNAHEPKVDLSKRMDWATYQLLRRTAEANPSQGRSACKPAHRGIYQPLRRAEVGRVYWTRIEDTPPLLVVALPSLRHEVLSVWYSLNTFRVPLRNTLDRRLCVKWLAERGALLKDMNSVRLQVPMSPALDREPCGASSLHAFKLPLPHVLLLPVLRTKLRLLLEVRFYPRSDADVEYSCTYGHRWSEALDTTT